MAGTDSMTSTWSVAGDQCGQFVLQFEGVEAVRGMPATVTSARHPGQRRGDPAPAAADVVVVHRLAQHDVGVGVEALGELVAVVLEVGLDGVPPALEGSSSPGASGRTARGARGRCGS